MRIFVVALANVTQEPVYLHLSSDNWKGDLMVNEGNNTYSVTRACPPGRLEFFFSILGTFGSIVGIIGSFLDEKALVDPGTKSTELSEFQKFEVIRKNKVLFSANCFLYPLKESIINGNIEEIRRD